MLATLTLVRDLERLNNLVTTLNFLHNLILYESYNNKIDFVFL